MAEAKKKLMLLGGLRYLLPVIEAAHRHSIHVITVDYLPDNIAHRYSDEYHNVSIIDKDAVLALAQELQIDGIMSFAVDPGAATKQPVFFRTNPDSVSSLPTTASTCPMHAATARATMHSKISTTSTGLSSSNPWTAPAAKA